MRLEYGPIATPAMAAGPHRPSRPLTQPASFRGFDSGGVVARLLSYLPALLWAALLLFIGGRSDVLTVDTDLPLDKAAHFVAYGVLGLLLAFAWRRSSRPRRPVWTLLAGLAIAALDELHQRSVPGRSADPIDWLVDALAIALAVFLVTRYTRKSANVVRDSV